MEAIDRLYKRDKMITRSVNIDQELYNQLQYLSDNVYDSSVNRIINVCAENALLKNSVKAYKRQRKSNQNEENNIEKTENIDREENFMKDLKEKTDIKNAQNKENIEYIVEKIEENPELLEKLTTEQLDDVDNYYTEKIEEVDKEISKIKNKK